MENDHRNQPTRVDFEIARIAKTEWKKDNGNRLSKKGEIIYADELIDKAITVLRANPSTRLRVDELFTRDGRVHRTFLKGRIDFGFAVQSDGEYLTLTIDNEEAVVELFHRKRGGLKSAQIVFFENKSKGKSTPLDGFLAAQRASGLIDKMAALLINDVPPRHPQQRR